MKKKIMTEDVVNEICKACSEALDNADSFVVFKNHIYRVDDAESGFYPWGEKIDFVRNVELTGESLNFLLDTKWLGNDYDLGLVFFIRDDDIIEMHLCYESYDGYDGFQPELSFTFKKTFDDGLFD